MANENGIHVNVMQLSDLMDDREQNGIFNLNKHFGNVYGLCNALDTSSNDGLIGTQKNLEQRRAAFVSNIFPLKKSKIFLRLIWEALKDVTLIILEVAAVISFALGFYNPLLDEDFEDSEVELENNSETEWAAIQELITIEGLRTFYSSCFTCGVNWDQDQVTLDCIECGGYAMERTCPECHGKCNTIWRRNLSMTHDSNKANWEGQCKLSSKY